MNNELHSLLRQILNVSKQKDDRYGAINRAKQRVLTTAPTLLFLKPTPQVSTQNSTDE